MKPYLRLLTGQLFIVSLLLISLFPTAGAASSATLKPHRLPLSPLSDGLLMAQALSAGRMPASVYHASPDVTPKLTCSPAPCVLPNVQASEGGPTVNETPIAANPHHAKQLLTGSNDGNCSSGRGFFTSNDAGSTWHHTCMRSLPGHSGCGADPGVGYDLHGTAFISGIDCGNNLYQIAFEKSTNNGATWSAPAVAVHAFFSGGFTDKPWLQIDDNPTSPHANALYISVTQFNSDQSLTLISVSHSFDGGKTWKTTPVDTEQSYPNIDQMSDLAIGKDGTLYASWLRCTANGPTGDCGGTTATLVLSKSTDGGNTWSAVTRIGTAKLAPDSCYCAFYGNLPNTREDVTNIPVIDIDHSLGRFAGHLYMVDYTWTGTYMMVQVTTSSNGGSTWSKPQRVTPRTDTHDQSYAWLTLSASGTVGVTWLDRRNDPQNLQYEAFAAVSTNGAKSFGTNVQLASIPSNPDIGFMGDYIGNIWVGNTLYAAWSDTRSGNFQDEIGGFKIS